MALPFYNHFLSHCAFLACGDEEVDTVDTVLHLIGVGVGVHGVVGFEVVKEGTPHVVHLDLNLASKVLEVECHLAVVGVGDDGEVGIGSILIDAIEGAHHPVSLRDALVGCAAVEGMCCQPDSVIHLVKDINLAALGLGTERLDDPVGSAYALPCDGVPATERVGIPEVEVVGVNLELGGGDDPVGSSVAEVHGIDGRGMGCVFHFDAHGDDAVAFGLVEVGPVIDTRHGIVVTSMVGVGDFVSFRIPEIIVTGLIFGDDEGVLVVVVDGEVERGFTLTAVDVGVVMGVDGAFGEGPVNVVVVVEPAVAVTTGDDDIVMVVGPELKVEDEGAVANAGEVKCVAVDTGLVVGDTVGGPSVFGAADGDIVALGVVFGLIDMDDDDTVAMVDGLIGEGVRLWARLEISACIIESRTALAGRLPCLELVDGVLTEVEPDGAVAVVDGLEGVEVDTRGGDVLVVELVSVVLAEVVADAGLVSLPVVEVEVDDAVAAVLGVQGVVIHARGMDVLSEVGVGVVLADGLVDVVLYIGVDM